MTTDNAIDNTGQPAGDETLYKDDFLMIRGHGKDDRIAVYVGHPPEDARPTIADANDLVDVLQRYVQTATDE